MGRISHRLFLTVIALAFCTAMLAACTAPSYVSTPTESVIVPTVTTVATKEPQKPTPTLFIKTFDPWVSITLPASALTPAVNPPEYQVSGGSIEADAEVLSQLSDAQIFRAYKWLSGQEDVPVYFDDQADYHKKMADFLRSHPELTVKQQQSPDKTSILTYIVKKNGDVSSILFGFKDGVLAFAEPNVADAETKLGEVVIPDGLTPEFVYNPADGHWYLFAVSKGGEPYYWLNTDGATIDNLDLQWQTYTEFEAEYPEGFELKEKSLKTIILTEPTTGMQIPMRIGLEKDMPFEEYEPTEEGKKLLVDYYLTACWSRYTIIEGHQIDKASFIQEVAAGKIRLRVPYVDMRTGKKKVGLHDPKDGFTTVFVFDEELPLQQTPKSNPEGSKSYYNLILNEYGIPIMVKNISKNLYEKSFKEDVLSGSEDVHYFYGDQVYSHLFRMISIFSGLFTKSLFESDGLVLKPETPQLLKVLDVYNQKVIQNLNKHADHPYFMIP